MFRDLRDEIRQEILGVVLVALTVLVYLGLFSPETGGFGDVIRRVLSALFGFAEFYVPAALGVAGLLCVFRKGELLSGSRALGWLLLLATVLGWLHRFSLKWPDLEFNNWPYGWGGGIVGAAVTWSLRQVFGTVGRDVALGALTLVAFLLATDVSLITFGAATWRGLSALAKWSYRSAGKFIGLFEERGRSRRKTRETEYEPRGFAASRTTPVAGQPGRAGGFLRAGTLGGAPPGSAGGVSPGRSGPPGVGGASGPSGPGVRAAGALAPAQPRLWNQPGAGSPEALPARGVGTAGLPGLSGTPEKPGAQAVPGALGAPSPATTGASSDEAGRAAGTAPDVGLRRPVAGPAAGPSTAPAAAGSAARDAQTGAPGLSRKPYEQIALTEDVLYELPPVSLLDQPNPAKSRRAKQDMEEQARVLEETLTSFGVVGKVVGARRGPVVTRFEFQPGPGIKVSRITSLADDIALHLAAQGVRIEAPIPGKHAVGIEVPNLEVSSVPLREVLEDPEVASRPSRLTVAFGKDITGRPITGDLDRLLHILIAGATGSGKSVCINAMLASLLFRAKPNEVKLLLIDPKVVELSVYEGIPHLVAPVVTDPKKAAGCLRWAVKQMEERYELFAAAGVRDIGRYNALVAETRAREAATAAGRAGRSPVLSGRGVGPGAGAAGPVASAHVPAVTAAGTALGRAELAEMGRDVRAGAGPQPLPYIVIVIDELADLMMVAPVDVEDAIWRLAQMARAAGIHLVVATQRPSVDVITGTIKANIPTRVAFAVSSQIDSRTIIDQPGAEKLLGHGDMLFMPVGVTKPVRVQGAYVSDKEIESLVEYVKSQGRPRYAPDVLAQEETAEEEGEEADDDLFEDAVRVVMETGQASISMLQRKLRVGYTRAGRLIDMMEEKGIVGPFEGSKAREIMMTYDQYRRSKEALRRVAAAGEAAGRPAGTRPAGAGGPQVSFRPGDRPAPWDDPEEEDGES